jgi:hypothetical protein
MKKLLTLILLLSVSLFGANLDQKKIESIKCPSQDFSLFLRVYTENIAVQKVFTKNPVEKLQLDLDAEPEPKPIVSILRHKKIAFPLIPNNIDRQKNNLVFSIEKNKEKKIKLLLTKPDTDYQVVYFFDNNDTCWVLDRIEDWSL